MNPNQEARKLIESFRVYRNDNGIEVPRMDSFKAAECALICVNKIIESEESSRIFKGYDDPFEPKDVDSRGKVRQKSYWKEVKKEIELFN